MSFGDFPVRDNAHFYKKVTIDNTPDSTITHVIGIDTTKDGLLRSSKVSELAVDSARAAGESDHADSCDTADFAYHSPATPHEVGIDTFAFAITDTTFDGGNLFRRGDTTVVGVQSSGELVSSGVTIPAVGPHYLAEDSNGDIYSAVRGNQIYKQTGGTGAFAAMGPPSRYYSGIAFDKNDSLWACTDSGIGRVGAVFRSDDYGVTWDSLPWPDHNYSGLGFDTLGNLYLASYGVSGGTGGKIWIKYFDTDTLDTLSEPALYYRGFACNEKNNDMYVAVSFGNIRKQTGGVGSFAPQTHSVGGTGVNFINCAVDTFGNVYVSSRNYYQFKQANGVGTFTPIPNSNYGSFGMYGVVGKANGDVAFEKDGPVYILSAEDSKIAFHIESGKFLSDGANILSHTIVDDEPDLIAGKNYSDNMIVYARPESLSVDSARISENSYHADEAETSYVAGISRYLLVPTDTSFITFADAADSLLKVTGAFYDKNTRSITFPKNIYSPNNGNFWDISKLGTDQSLWLSVGGFNSADSGAYIGLRGMNNLTRPGALTLASGYDGFIWMQSASGIVMAPHNYNLDTSLIFQRVEDAVFLGQVWEISTSAIAMDYAGNGDAKIRIMDDTVRVVADIFKSDTAEIEKLNGVYQVSSTAELLNLRSHLGGANASYVIDDTLLVNTSCTSSVNMACIGFTGNGFVTGVSNMVFLNWNCDPDHQVFDTTVTVILPNIYRLEYFGGRQDSSTINTSAINATLNSIKAAGKGTLNFKNGVYITTGDHALQGVHNLTMQGSGDSRLFLADGSDKSMFYTDYTGIENFKCLNVKFNGNYQNQTRITAGIPWYRYVCGALVLSSVNNGKVSGCEFWNCAYGVNIGTNGVGNKVSVTERCYFNTCGVGVDSYGKHFKVINNEFENMLSIPAHSEAGIAIVIEPVQESHTVKAHQSNDTVYVDSMGTLIKFSEYFIGQTLTWTTSNPATSPARDSLVGLILSIINDTSVVVRDTCTRASEIMIVQKTLDETIGEDTLWYYNENFSLNNIVSHNTINECDAIGIALSGNGSSSTLIEANTISNVRSSGISAYQIGHQAIKIQSNVIRNVRDTSYLPQVQYGHGIVIAGPRNMAVIGNITEYCNNGIYCTGSWSYGRKDRIIIESNMCSFNAKNGIFIYNTDGAKISNNYLFNNNISRTSLAAGVYLNSTTYHSMVSGNLTYETDTAGQDYGVYIENGDNSRQLMIGRNPTVGTSSGELWGNLSNVAPENYINKKIVSDGSTGEFGVSGFTVIPDTGKSDAALISFLPFARAAGESRAYTRISRNNYLPQTGTHILNGGQILVNSCMISSRPSTPSVLCTTSVNNDTLKCFAPTYLLPGDRVLLKGARDSSGTPVDLNTTVEFVSNDFKTVTVHTAPTVSDSTVTGYCEFLIGDIILRQSSSGGLYYCRTATTSTSNAVWDWIFPTRGSPTDGEVVNYNASGYAEWTDTVNVTQVVADTVHAGMLRQTGTWHAAGGFQDSSVTITFTGADEWKQITNASKTLWQGTEVVGFSFSNDTMTAINTAHYIGNVDLSVSSLNGKDYEIQLYNVTQDDMWYSRAQSTTGATNSNGMSQGLYFDATAGDKLVMQIKNSTDGTSVTVTHGSFWLSYLHD